MVGHSHYLESGLGRRPWLVGLLAFLVALLPSFVFYARTGGDPDGSVLADLWPGLIVSSVLLSAFVLATGWAHQVGFCKPHRNWWKWYVLPAVWALALLAVGRLADWGEPEEFPLAGLIAVLLLVGFTEEVVFRGFLIQSFRGKMPVAWAVAVSSALFALTHTGTGDSAVSVVVTILAVLGLAVTQAGLYLVGGSIYPVIAFHVWWDLMMFSGGGIELGGDATTLAWFALLATVGATLGYGWYLIARILPKTDAIGSAEAVAESES